MNSLFQILIQQHREEFAPLRCNEQTMLRLARYFEDLVTENKLSALVIEGRCPKGHPLREPERLAKVAAIARRLYLFCCDRKCTVRTWEPEAATGLMTIEEPGYHELETGPFILVTEPRFCGLLASRAVKETDRGSTAYEVVWTFDPNVVFTAIEYLMARFGVQQPTQREEFESVLHSSTPASSSLRLALAFMTKLTVLMQRQNVLEMATNRISSAISSSLELESILQSAVEEVGGALKARRAALVLWHEGTSSPEGMTVYERHDHDSASARIGDLEDEDPFLPEGDGGELPDSAGLLEVPVTYRDTIVGVLAVEDDRPGRNWEDEEVRMVKTVSDQLAVAIDHARLFRQMQMQALTDSLTGLANHGCFQSRLERELKLADRHNHQLSLILLDLDQLKRINDTYGHVAGDAALCHVAAAMRSSVREIDVCARYGGEEFCIILPACSRDDALDVAERVRETIASMPVARIGQVTASFGVATYPIDASEKEDLVEMADRAMYLAKAAGRNRV
ncbi:MAG TPA: diguanylate cyclase, partial [Blastocatellia bacterium]|nr:diguanylate cyclase [Blastocatellia bacterium]